MRYRLIDEETPHHAVSRLARLLGVSRAGYYAWVGRPPSKRALADAALRRRIEQIHEAADGIYGAPRIHAEPADAQAIRVGRKRVARLLRQAGLAGVSKRRSFRTATPGGEAPAAPDLVARKFTAKRPNELWFADITYLPTWQGWLYLAAVVDACSRYCVGLSMRDDLSADLLYDALGMAVTRRRPGADLIHHSDRGSQYRSLAYGRLLRESKIMPSMWDAPISGTSRRVSVSVWWHRSVSLSGCADGVCRGVLFRRHVVERAVQVLGVVLDAETFEQHAGVGEAPELVLV